MNQKSVVEAFGIITNISNKQELIADYVKKKMTGKNYSLTKISLNQSARGFAVDVDKLAKLAETYIEIIDETILNSIKKEIEDEKEKLKLMGVFWDDNIDFFPSVSLKISDNESESDIAHLGDISVFAINSAIADYEQRIKKPQKRKK